MEPIFDKIKGQLDSVTNDILCEIENEREMKEAMREIQRSENMLKYKQEIQNRPKKEWFQSKKKRDDIKKQARDNLPQMKKNFEDNLASQPKSKKKREAKQE